MTEIESLLDSVKPDVSKDSLENITSLAEQQLQLETQRAQLEEALGRTKEELRDVSVRQLPQAMQEAGLKDFTLENGRKVTIRTVYNAEAKTDEQLDWFEQNGFGSIIKNALNIDLGKGVDPQKVAELIDRANEMGFEADQVRSIHHMTLRKTIKEIVEETDGETELPSELLKVYIGSESKVK